MELVSRVFDRNSHARFSELSRDHNPIHVNPIAARRTQAGATIVHGIHSLLWLLNCLAEQDRPVPAVGALKARFIKPIYVDTECKAELLDVTSNMLRARVVVNGTEALRISIRLGEQRGKAQLPLTNEQPVPLTALTQPAELRLDQLAGRAGCLSFASIVAESQAMFPGATRWLGAQVTAALVSCSCLVGMVVPGLHSLFSGLTVSFCNNGGAKDTLQFSVSTVDLRFRLVTLAVLGGGLCGSLEVVSVLPPVKQPSMATVAKRVARDEFRGVLALIVGGSRGLGELTAKIIAAGGGSVVITYAVGKADANAVSEEIRRAGTDCYVTAYDIRRPASEQLAQLEGLVPTHVYYFATPPIFRPKARVCDLERFAEFNAFYIAGFLDLMQGCLGRRPEGIVAFYPSSVAVETRPADMTEYAMSKAAGEVLCSDIHEYFPHARVLVRRLPRLATDQTSSIMQVETVDPITPLLAIVREMHS